MADLSKITLPNASTVTLKDNSQTHSDHRHYSSDTVPLVHKLYESTDYYASTGSWEASSWYFMSIRPDEWYKPWRVKFKVHSYCAKKNNDGTFTYPSYQSYTWSTFCGRSDGYIVANWNERQNTAHYYTPIYILKKAGYDAGYGHAIGISILYGDNYTNANYYRSFEIDYYECENCTVTILDTPVKWSGWTGGSTTNYNSISAPDAVNRGLQETGDNNTITENRISYFPGKTGAKGIWATGLFMEDASGTYQSICTASDGTVTANNRTTATTKIANTNGFKPLGTIWYCNTTYAANTNINGGSVVYSGISLFDSRYSLNTQLVANSLTPFTEVYLVGTINATDGLFYLDSTWWTQTPNDTNKIYVLIGACWDSTTSNCRITLYEQNKWYRYNGTNLIEIANDTRTVNGHTVDKDVPSDAVFTDTTYTGTGAISVNSSTHVISTTAEVNQNAFSNVKVGSTTIAADTKTDTLELVAGSNVTLTPDATNDKVTIAATDTDTKNTAGNTDTSSKIYLIGATSQTGPSAQTYSQDTAYIGTDGHVYSNSKQVVNLSDTQALTNKTYNGYTLAAACAKAVVTSVDTSASLPTSNAVKTFVEGKGYVTTDTKNTTGSTDTSSKIYLVGATSQAANPQTYSDNEVYTTSGTLTTNKVQVGGGNCTLEYNTSTASLDFIFS